MTNDFTPGELKILKYLSQGDTTRIIARKMMWMHTVVEIDRFITNMKNRHHCENRVHLVATAIRRGIID